MPTCPPCDFCSGPGNCWKIGQLNACARCAATLDIMQKDGILQHSETPQYGGPEPGDWKSKF